MELHGEQEQITQQLLARADLGELIDYGYRQECLEELAEQKAKFNEEFDEFRAAVMSSAEMKLQRKEAEVEIQYQREVKELTQSLEHIAQHVAYTI